MGSVFGGEQGVEALDERVVGLRHMACSGVGDAHGAHAPIAVAGAPARRVPGGCERVHGLRHHVRLEVERLSEAGLVDAVRASGQQLHQHAVLRHAEAAGLRQPAFERAMGEVERDEERRVERKVALGFDPIHAQTPPFFHFSRALQFVHR